MKAYWWNAKPNFGDALTPLLLKVFAGIDDVQWAPPAESEIVVCGSVLGDFPIDYRGIVLGAGKMGADKRALSYADVRALRGPLSGVAPLYADPGILAGLLPHRRLPTLYKTGVLPHYIDKKLAYIVDGDENLHEEFEPSCYLDITQDLQYVIEQAHQCDRIISSSLHGLILADSLGLPRRWEPCPQVLGHGFKFHDYQRGLDACDMVPGEWYTANPEVIDDTQHHLKRLFEELK